MPEEEKPTSERQDQILILLSELGKRIDEYETALEQVPNPEKADFRRKNPDQWVIILMNTMRHAAVNIMHWDLVRLAFIKLIVLLVVMLREGDARFGCRIITPPGFGKTPTA